MQKTPTLSERITPSLRLVSRPQLLETAFQLITIIICGVIIGITIAISQLGAANSPITLAATATVLILGLATLTYLYYLSVRLTRQQIRILEIEVEKAFRLQASLEQQLRERTKERKQVQLERMQQLYRFVELGRMTSGIIHDLVNPLAALSLSLEELQSRSSSRIVKEIVVSANRMQRFIQAARKQVQSQEQSFSFSVNEEIEDTINILAYKAKEHQVAIQLLAHQSISLVGNPIKFQQIITNIVSNAIDAYPPEYVSARRNVAIKLLKRRTELLITIQDWGIGIAQNQLSRIFEPLFTTKSPDKGLGIGLSMSKGLIEKDFAGRITVESRLKRGTLFKLTIPIREELTARRKQAK